jgi:hypothetical protein
VEVKKATPETKWQRKRASTATTVPRSRPSPWVGKNPASPDAEGQRVVEDHLHGCTGDRLDARSRRP